jgi:hypothetical protein
MNLVSLVVQISCRKQSFSNVEIPCIAGQFLISKLGKEEDILASLEQKQNLRTKYGKLKELEDQEKKSVKSTIQEFEDEVKENGIIKLQLEKASQDFMPYTFLIK